MDQETVAEVAESARSRKPVRAVKSEEAAVDSTAVAPADDPFMEKIRQRADGRKQKLLNIVNRYVPEHPAICLVPGCKRDFMREHLSTLKRHQIGDMADPNHADGYVEPDWKDLDHELQERLLKALNYHKREHDAGDVGRVRKSQLATKYLGNKRGL